MHLTRRSHYRITQLEALFLADNQLCYEPLFFWGFTQKILLHIHNPAGKNILYIFFPASCTAFN